MLDVQIIRRFTEQGRVIDILHQRLIGVEKAADKSYLNSLTHVMMWDVLLGLLSEKGIITKEQFDQALKELSDKTKAAMEAEQKAAGEKKKLATEGKVTVLSDVPAIPVEK